MKYNIDEIFEMLSWDNINEIQELGIEEAKKIKQLSVLILPTGRKSVWENCAKVLVSKTNCELSMYFIQLFEWLKDMNWPGAFLIYERLLDISDQEMLSAYQYSVLVAKQTYDNVWEKVLNDFYFEYSQRHNNKGNTGDGSVS